MSFPVGFPVCRFLPLPARACTGNSGVVPPQSKAGEAPAARPAVPQKGRVQRRAAGRFGVRRHDAAFSPGKVTEKRKPHTPRHAVGDVGRDQGGAFGFGRLASCGAGVAGCVNVSALLTTSRVRLE